MPGETQILQIFSLISILLMMFFLIGYLIPVTFASTNDDIRNLIREEIMGMFSDNTSKISPSLERTMEIMDSRNDLWRWDPYNNTKSPPNLNISTSIRN